LDPEHRRGTSSAFPGADSIVAGYTGTLRISETVLMKVGTLESKTLLLTGEKVLRFYQGLGYGDGGYWVRQLQAAGITAGGADLPHPSAEIATARKFGG